MNKSDAGCNIVAVEGLKDLRMPRVYVVPDGIFLSNGDNVIVSNPFSDEHEDMNAVCVSNSQYVSPELYDIISATAPYKITQIKAICNITWLTKPIE